MTGSDPLHGPACPNPECGNGGLLVGRAQGRRGDWVCYKCGACFDYDSEEETPYVFHGYNGLVRSGLRGPPPAVDRQDMGALVARRRKR